jgi:hypothetical protein
VLTADTQELVCLSTVAVQLALGVAVCITVSLRIDFLLLQTWPVVMAPGFAAFGAPLLAVLVTVVVGPLMVGRREGWVVVALSALLLLASAVPFISELLAVLVLEGRLAVSAIVMAVPWYVVQAPLVVFGVVQLISGLRM